MAGETSNGKIWWIVSGAVVTILLGIFFNVVYSMSATALDRTVKHGEDIVQLKQCYADIKERIVEIKDIQKRHLEISANNNVEIQKIIELLKRR